MRDTIALPLKLAIMMLIAALCLGLTNMVTQEPIRQQQIRQAEALRLEVLPGASGFEAADVPDAPSSLSAAYRSAGGAQGYVFEMTANGFGGAMGVTVGIGSSGQITGVRVGSHGETPGLGAKATDPAFYGQYGGKSARESLSVTKLAPTKESEVQAITAATVTSNAVTSAVNDAIAAYQSLTGGAQ